MSNVGRVSELDILMNRERLVRARRFWVAWGEHPPQIQHTVYE